MPPILPQFEAATEFERAKRALTEKQDYEARKLTRAKAQAAAHRELAASPELVEIVAAFLHPQNLALLQNEKSLHDALVENGQIEQDVLRISAHRYSPVEVQVLAELQSQTRVFLASVKEAALAGLSPAGEPALKEGDYGFSAFQLCKIFSASGADALAGVQQRLVLTMLFGNAAQLNDVRTQFSSLVDSALPIFEKLNESLEIVANERHCQPNEAADPLNTIEDVQRHLQQRDVFLESRQQQVDTPLTDGMVHSRMAMAKQAYLDGDLPALALFELGIANVPLRQVDMAPIAPNQPPFSPQKSLRELSAWSEGRSRRPGA